MKLSKINYCKIVLENSHYEKNFRKWTVWKLLIVSQAYICIIVLSCVLLRWSSWVVLRPISVSLCCAVKVIVHETCHLFYFAHCVFFDCLMNDSRSVSEAMSQPLHLCPVCSRKLHKVLRIRSATEHHRTLLAHLSSLVDYKNIAGHRMLEEIDWLRRCIAYCEGSRLWG